MKFFLFLLLIIFITFFAIGQSLHFALDGDSWLTLYRYIKDFTTFGSHFDLKNYSTDYGNYVFADIIMGIIYRLFSFNPFPYYLISIIFRVVTAISFYPAVFAATKDKFAAILASIFFASMYAGIETTNWVFNMNTYVSISLFNFFIYLYYSKEFKILSLRGISTSLILALSFIVTQNRMHGLLFIIPLLALFKIHKFNKENLGKALIRLVVLFLPIFVYRFVTKSSNDTAYADSFVQALSQWKNLILSIFSSIGNALVPEKIYTIFNTTNESKAIFVFLVFFILFLSLFKKDFRSKKYFFTLISLSISIFFLIIPLILYGPSGTLSSDHRYLIIPGAYLLVAFAILLSDLLRQKNQFFKTGAITLIIIIITVNLISLRNYFSMLSENGRSAGEAERQFKFIISQIETPRNDAPLVFLFIPDNPLYLYNAITFGFSYHLILIDNRFGLGIQKAPFPVDNLDSLLDVLSSEQSSELRRYGYNPIKIPIENVYMFQLQNKTLTNITPWAREYLTGKLYTQ